jgi:uncharacterized protein GlcG (DUF336 family)
MKNRTPRRLLAAAGAALAAAALAWAGLGSTGCSAGKSGPLFSVDLGADDSPLTAAEAQLIALRAAAAIESDELHAAVVDRTGQILAVYSTVPSATVQDEDNIAVSLARTTAFFSNSQAPLSSRTVQALSTFHFPPTFAAPFLASVCPQSGRPECPDTAIAPQLTTTGVAGTPPGPLWQINATNRGAPIATADTVPETQYNPGKEYPRSLNIDGTFPSPGITLLPGAVPLYRPNSSGVPRLVGGVGVFIRRDASDDPDLAAGEYAAIQGAFGDGTPGNENFFLPLPSGGAVFLLGILLPYVEQTALPAGAVPRSSPLPLSGMLVGPNAGNPAPEGYLIGPRESQDPPAGAGQNGLTQAEVDTIIQQAIVTADGTRSAIRLPLGSSARIIAVVTDLRGLILAHYRMPDTLTDAVDVVPAKARTTVYYSRPGGPDPADQWPGFPVNTATGVAITTRTLGFLSQPFYPPGIDGNGPGPLFQLAIDNQRAFLDASQTVQPATRLGSAPPDPGYQNGLIFFPGSVPLYKSGQLVGALGVSGDGVEQNDFIAAGGGRGFEPPPELRIDNFSFGGVRLPYLKFPPNPRLEK